MKTLSGKVVAITGAIASRQGARVDAMKLDVRDRDAIDAWAARVV